MFLPATKTPTWFVLSYDRQSECPTVFWLVPMTAEDYGIYTTAWDREDRRLGLPDELRAKKKIQVDREQFQRIVVRVDNAFEPGDSLTKPEELARVCNTLDWPSLQEVVREASSTSRLQEAQKNCSGFSPNGAPTPSTPGPLASASRSTASSPAGSPATTT